MLVAADYPFLDVLWTMLIFFLWVIWFWILITVFADIFRRHDVSGWSKALWMVFVIFLPFLGVLVYLGVNSKGMAERNVKTMRRVPGSDGRVHPDRRVERRPGRRDREGEGAARQRRDRRRQEFDALKQKALAGA